MATSEKHVQSISSSDERRPPSTSAESHASSSNLLTHHQYATDHILQSYELYIPPSSSSSYPQPPIEDEGASNDNDDDDDDDDDDDNDNDNNNNKIWLIHIHGGAWRDPTITALNSFAPTLTHLLNPAMSSSTNPNPVTNQISGYISLNYRLSPHPTHSQNPTTTPPSHLRNAKHPNHIHDILTALRSLQSSYAFGSNYILVGHSCGGTLAWQVAMSRTWGAVGFEDVKPPMAIVSVCAIYDLPLLVRTFGDVPAYKEFTVGAFGGDEGVWEGVSPARWRGYGESWRGGTEEEEEGGRKLVAMLAHSTDDELVDWAQVEGMERALGIQQVQQREAEDPNDGIGASWNGLFHLLELKGKHNEVWQQGEEMARAITLALKMLGTSPERIARSYSQTKIV